MASQEENKSKDKDQSLFGKLKSVFTSDSKEGKKDKDVLVDYNKVFEEEKNKRHQERDSLLYKKTPPKKYPDPPKPNISVDEDDYSSQAKGKPQASAWQKEAGVRDQGRNQTEKKQSSSQSTDERVEKKDKSLGKNESGQNDQTTFHGSQSPPQNKNEQHKGFRPKSFLSRIKEKLRDYKRQSFSTSETIKTNLIEGEDGVSFDWKSSLKILGINLVVALTIVGSLYGAVYYLESRTEKKSGNIEEEIERLDKIVQDKEEKVKNTGEVQKKTEVVSMLLDRHVYWTNFFRFLEKNTIPEVYFTGGFSGSTNGEYSFPAITDNFESITEQVAVLQKNDQVVSAAVKSGSLSVKQVKKEDDEAGVSEEEQIVSFTLQLKVKPSVFYMKDN